MNEKELTAGDLRKALQDVPDDAELHIWTEGRWSYCRVVEVKDGIVHITDGD